MPFLIKDQGDRVPHVVVRSKPDMRRRIGFTLIHLGNQLAGGIGDQGRRLAAKGKLQTRVSLPPGSGNTRFYETARPEKSVPDFLGGK